MKYLGIDWGMKHFGAAISSGEIATPLQNFEIVNFQQGVEKIEELVADEGIDFVVVGKPEGEMGKLVDKLIQALSLQGIKVVLSDETLTSHDSLQSMIDLGVPKLKRRGNHQFAASLILQRFLDQK